MIQNPRTSNLLQHDFWSETLPKFWVVAPSILAAPQDERRREFLGWTSQNWRKISHGITWHSYTVNWSTDFFKRSSYTYIYMFSSGNKKRHLFGGRHDWISRVRDQNQDPSPKKGWPWKFDGAMNPSFGFLLHVSLVKSQIKRKVPERN